MYSIIIKALSASSADFLAALIAPTGRLPKLGMLYFLPLCSNSYLSLAVIFFLSFSG